MPSFRVKILIAVTVALAVAITATHFPVIPALKHFCAQVGHMGWVGALCVALMLAAGSLCFLPASPFIITAAAVFGFWLGLMAGVLGLALGASCGFLLSRWLLRKDVAARLRKHPTFESLDVAIEREGWKIIILLRLCPIPFGMANYLYGLTGIPFRPYLLTSLLGSLPSTLLFCHLGAAGKASLEKLAAGHVGHHGGEMILLGLSLAATVAVIVVLPRFAKKAIAKYAKVSLPSP
ncbi:MAG: VTT domain-containing protein [Verrucomicrobia bacterium]|nr:VTT domain-containing protein [Verrucomicrobiota bacterium]